MKYFFTRLPNFESAQPMIRSTLYLLITVSLSWPLDAQTDTVSIYHVRRLRSALIGSAGIALHQWGLHQQRQAPGVAPETILNLNPDDVYSFDRSALRQAPQRRRQAAELSDHALNASLILPFSLFLDRSIRHDWLDVTLLYIEAQALSNNLYAWSPFGPTFVDRMRPVAYYAEVPLEERMDNKTRQSFFSGHTSSVATATFFMAKVYADYHPETTGRKWLIYGLAAVPPTFVGIYRIKALRHFPSDVVVGGLVGAASGVLIPHLHKKWQAKAQLSLIYRDQAKGLAFSLDF